MNDRHLDLRALQILLDQPEIVAWLGLSREEFATLVESKRQNEHETPQASQATGLLGPFASLDA